MGQNSNQTPKMPINIAPNKTGVNGQKVEKTPKETNQTGKALTETPLSNGWKGWPIVEQIVSWGIGGVLAIAGAIMMFLSGWEHDLSNPHYLLIAGIIVLAIGSVIVGVQLFFTWLTKHAKYVHTNCDNHK